MPEASVGGGTTVTAIVVLCMARVLVEIVGVVVEGFEVETAAALVEVIALETAEDLVEGIALENTEDLVEVIVLETVDELFESIDSRVWNGLTLMTLVVSAVGCELEVAEESFSSVLRFLLEMVCKLVYATFSNPDDVAVVRETEQAMDS